jgi:hypothetical protein
VGRKDGEPVADLAASRRDLLEIEGLPAGGYALAAEVGDWQRDPVVLAREEVRIVAGARTVATVDLPRVEIPEQVPLSGRVVVPEAWEISGIELYLELQDAPVLGAEKSRRLSPGNGLQPVAGSPGTWRFDAGRVQSGEYRLRVSPPGYARGFRLEPPGNTDVEIPVPPPGSVSLRVVDGATGRDAEPEAVEWFYARPRGTEGGGVEHVRKNEQSGRYEFRAPQGTVTVLIWDDGYEPASADVTVSAGRTEATITLHALCGIRLTFKEGDATVPCEWGWDVEVEPLTGEGYARRRRVSAGGRALLLKVTESGRYVVRIPDIEGFRPIADFTVDVEAGETVERVVRLERER